MRYVGLLLAIAALTSLTFGQQQPVPSQSDRLTTYQPAVPPPSMGGYGGGGWGWGGGGVGSTAAGSSLTGMANVISASGDYNLATSAAAVNMTQAQRQEIQNRQLYTNTYFDMRQTNHQAREAERAPRSTMEQIARIAHEAAPKPMTHGDVDEVTGKLNWPDVLQLDSFAAQRRQLESLYGSYTELGSLNYSDQMKARKIINSMASELKSQIRSVPSSDYITSKNFLRSLMYTTCKSDLG